MRAGRARMWAVALVLLATVCTAARGVEGAWDGVGELVHAVQRVENTHGALPWENTVTRMRMHVAADRAALDELMVCDGVTPLNVTAAWDRAEDSPFVRGEDLAEWDDARVRLWTGEMLDIEQWLVVLDTVLHPNGEGFPASLGLDPVAVAAWGVLGEIAADAHTRAAGGEGEGGVETEALASAFARAVPHLDAAVDALAFAFHARVLNAAGEPQPLSAMLAAYLSPAGREARMAMALRQVYVQMEEGEHGSVQLSKTGFQAMERFVEHMAHFHLVRTGQFAAVRDRRIHTDAVWWLVHAWEVFAVHSLEREAAAQRQQPAAHAQSDGVRIETVSLR